MAGMGNTLHSHHPRLQQDEITFPTRLLSSSNKTTLKDLGNSHAGSGVSVNYIAEKTGHIVIRQNVAYINGLCNNLKFTGEMGINNSTEKMIKYLVTKKYDHVVFYHNHVDKKLYNEANLEASFVKALNLSMTDKLDVSKYVHETRT